MVVCVQAVVGENIFLVQFQYGNNIEMISCFLVFLCSKEAFEMDEPL